MLLFLLFLPLAVFGQDQIDLSQVVFGTVIEVARDGETIERLVVGVPTSKILLQDADFTKRAASRWQFVSSYRLGENVKCWLRGDQPTTGNGVPIGYGLKSDLPAADILLDIPLSDYNAAPALGDSLYFLHADPRTKLVDGVQLIQEDSREWGPVHAREFLRIVAPEPDE